MADPAFCHNGVLLVDKKSGLTSHDVVARIRRLSGQRRVGHTGTLDPLAEGLLVVCLGYATKAARFLSDQDKTYEAALHLGRTSTTYDAEGVVETSGTMVGEFDNEALLSTLNQFVGTTTQRVPAYSAIHVDGERLYAKARRGEEPDLPERTVRIHSIELLGYTAPLLRLKVSCAKGTYIRSLANDIGLRLGCGAYLSALRRTAIGNLSVENAMTLEHLAQAVSNGTFPGLVHDLSDVMNMGGFCVSDDFSRLVLHGRDLKSSDVVGVEGAFCSGDHVLLKDRHGRVLAVGRALVASNSLDSASCGHLFRYDRVFN